jgi:hypothetical protein
MALLATGGGTANGGVVQDCVGDCAGNGSVAIDELVLGVNIALGNQPVSRCTAMDGSGDGSVTIDELTRAVLAALDGCAPAAATATPSASPTATASPIDTDTATPTHADPTATATAEHSATATPTDTAEPSATPTFTPATNGNPSDLTAVIDGPLVRLAWVPPDPASGRVEVVVLRRLNAAVTGPDDPEATLIFAGAATTTTDEVAQLLPDVPETARRYFYAVFGCNSGSSACERTGASATLEPTLAAVLRAGGYVLYFRHASATVCVDRTDLGTAAMTSVPNWWKSCDANCPIDGPITATARQLDSTGPLQAMAIAQAFDALAVPVGRVLSSEFCRCVITAQLMDLGPPIEQVQEITYFVHDEPNRCANSFARINDAPTAGTNTAIVSHIGFSPFCPPIDQLAPAEAAIFKPDGQGANTFVTRVTSEQWAAFVEARPPLAEPVAL